MDFTRQYMKLMQIVLRMILKIFIWDDFVDVWVFKSCGFEVLAMQCIYVESSISGIYR